MDISDVLSDTVRFSVSSVDFEFRCDTVIQDLLLDEDFVAASRKVEGGGVAKMQAGRQQVAHALSKLDGDLFAAGETVTFTKYGAPSWRAMSRETRGFFLEASIAFSMQMLAAIMRTATGINPKVRE